MTLDLTLAIESLRFDFETIRNLFENAKTHDEQLELVAIAREIITEARWQIAEYRAAFQ
jgi:hypothetical protein